MTFKVNTVPINFSLLNQSDLIAMGSFLLSSELIGNTLHGLKLLSPFSLKIKIILKPVTIKSILDHLPDVFQERISTYCCLSELTSRELSRPLLSCTDLKSLLTKFSEATHLSKFKSSILKLTQLVLLSVLPSQLSPKFNQSSSVTSVMEVNSLTYTAETIFLILMLLQQIWHTPPQPTSPPI